MAAYLLELAPAKKLRALREADIFHPWHSLDEKRHCRRCGQIFTGRQIKVYRVRGEGMRYRLECPTEGCPSVPIEWMVSDGLPREADRPLRWFAND
jgi:hypothetical protein